MSQFITINGVEYDEGEVRKLRDYVFERPSTDKNWEGCREHWLTPDACRWLSEQYRVMMQKQPSP
jgi:hypothetical protein